MLSHKRHDLKKKKVTKHKTCVLIFSTNLLETFLILGRVEPEMTTNVCWSSCKVPVIPVGFKLNLKILERCSKNTQILKFHENTFGGLRVFPMEQINMTKQVVTFRKFAKALKKCQKKRHRNLVCELQFL